MCGGGGGGGGNLGQAAANRAAQEAAAAERARNEAAAEAARQAEAANQAELARRNTNRTNSMSALNEAFGFANDDYFGGIKSAYTGLAGGALDNEYGVAAGELNRIIGKSGQGTRSEGAKARAGLAGQRQAALGSIAQTGEEYANKARAAIDTARNEFMSKAESGEADLSGDIRSRAQSLSAMPQFSAPGSFLGDAGERRQDWVKNLFSGKSKADTYNPLFGGSQGSQTIVG